MCSEQKNVHIIFPGKLKNVFCKKISEILPFLLLFGLSAKLGLCSSRKLCHLSSSPNFPGKILSILQNNHVLFELLGRCRTDNLQNTSVGCFCFNNDQVPRTTKGVYYSPPQKKKKMPHDQLLAIWSKIPQPSEDVPFHTT